MSTGLLISWGAVHKRGGRLVSRQVSLEAPGDITCVRPSCLIKYIGKSLRYVLILLYHRYRIEYAEAYPDANIKWKYRTGEDAPETAKRTAVAVIILEIRRLGTWLRHRNLQRRVMRK